MAFHDPPRTRSGRHFSQGSKALRVVMETHGWSLNELARQLGTQTSNVSAWLFGDRIPGLFFALRMQEILKINPALWLQAANDNKHSAAPAVAA